MTTRVTVFHCCGTSNLGGLLGIIDTFGKVVQLGTEILQFFGLWAPTKMYTVAGLRGRTAGWNLQPPSDPFVKLLDPEIFDARKIAYPANVLPIGQSMRDGIANVTRAINDLPVGQPFMTAGYSQGAAVMSSIYNEIRSGSLSARANDFLGGVCFGNPRRQVNYRGAVGGSWSGSLYNQAATTGGKGAFPATGEFARLTGCDTSDWLEFTAPTDIFCSVGDTLIEQRVTEALDVATNLLRQDLGYFIDQFDDLVANFLDVAGQFAVEYTATDANGVQFACPGGGHMEYAFKPPPGTSGATSYQLAMQWMETKAAEFATAPIVLPDTPISAANAGWSTTLIPPAA